MSYILYAITNCSIQSLVIVHTTRKLLPLFIQAISYPFFLYRLCCPLVRSIIAVVQHPFGLRSPCRISALAERSQYTMTMSLKNYFITCIIVFCDTCFLSFLVGPGINIDPIMKYFNPLNKSFSICDLGYNFTFPKACWTDSHDAVCGNERNNAFKLLKPLTHLPTTISRRMPVLILVFSEEVALSTCENIL